MRLILMVAVCVVLAGCGVVQRAQIEAKQTQMRERTEQWRSEAKRDTASLKERCTNLIENAHLDLLRGKVQFVRFVTDGATPFEYLSNETFPTSPERQQIAKWAALRDQCNGWFESWKDVKGRPPGLSDDVWQKFRSFAVRAEELITELTVALYQGKISYGEFARRRQAVADDARTSSADYLQALKEADYQRRLAAEEVAEQHYQAQVQAQQNWLNVMGVGVAMMNHGGTGGSGNGRIICNSNSMASGTMPNPTICQNF